MTVLPGTTKTFLVVVELPLTGITNGTADTITVNATSQANPTMSYTSQLTTHIPVISFNMQTTDGNAIIKPGQTHDYVIQIQNSGLTNDTYDLRPTFGNFMGFIKNISDDTCINSITVNAGQIAQYLLKVTVPLTGISNGQSDTITIDAVSQSNPALNSRVEIVTTTPSFSHNLVKLSNDAVIYPGRSFNYHLAIENVGLSNDTYDLSLNSGSFSYTIRNASNTANIHSISINAGLSGTFIVKATYPSAGANNGQSESIDVRSISQGNSLDTNSVQITSSAPSAAFGITNLSGDMEVYPGKANNYEMVIANNSQTEDTYDLSISGGSWPYSIRNASDTSNIYAVSLGAGMTQTFLIKVLIPKGVSNGSSESIMVNGVSQSNQAITAQEQITTSTPSFSFTMQRLNADTNLNPGEPFTYTFVITNTSSGDDTFSLTKTTANWTYAIRNATNTANIRTLSVGAGLSATFLVNVDVPLTQTSTGEIDSITLYVMSQSNNSVNDRATITSSIFSYGLNLQNLTGNSILYAGQKKNYQIQVENTGNGLDTYHLSIKGGTFDYIIRNASDDATINSLSVGSSQTKDFLIKVSAPITGIANGHVETITLTVVSVVFAISESIQITTSTPMCTFDLSPKTNTASIIPGNSKIYPVRIENTGGYDDTYGLSIIGGNWPHRIVNAIDSSTLNTLSVAAGSAITFNVKMDVPSSGVSVGDSDRIYLKAISMCNPAISSQITFTTDIPAVSYELKTSSNKQMVYWVKLMGIASIFKHRHPGR
ncbi:MAG: hypothetical protein OMM_10489, partial [Candidatus Magnetoglobus multicellularis str. Araruama]